MRRVPIYSDRYWELKPRRNALRGRCDGSWLQQLRYGTDYLPVFQEVPDGWKERWRLLRELTERWHGIAMPDVGGRVKEVRKIERKLGLKLPPSVREWVAFGCDLESQSQFSKVLRDSYDVRKLEDLSAVSLLLQCEGDCYWAVREDDLEAPDPAVQDCTLDYEDEEENRFVEHGHNPFAPHVTTFVFQHMAGYLNGNGGGFGTGVQVTDQLIRQLTAAFPFRSQFDGLRVFEKRNMIVLLGESPYRAPGDTESHIQVEVWKRLPKREVPAFLWEFTRNGGYFHGMFIPKTRG
jgi:hypothetical protein